MAWKTVEIGMKAIETSQHQGMMARDSKGLAILMAVRSTHAAFGCTKGDIRCFLILLQIFCPLVLSASIFSITNLEQVIPFLRPGLKCFIAVNVFLSVLTFVIYSFLQDGIRYWRQAWKRIPRRMRITDNGITIIRNHQGTESSQYEV